MSTNVPLQDPTSDETWQKLYPMLRSLARQLIYSFNVSSWRGQEEDIVEDVVQETVRRTLEYSHKAARNETRSIHSLVCMTTTIVRNYCRDLRRHDLRMRRFSNQAEMEGVSPSRETIQPSEIGTENVYQEQLFVHLAHEIAAFPPKQRNALLVDLANRSSFGSDTTTLQKAFLVAGIQLEKYKQSLPEDKQKRTRYTSLRSIAYRRVSKLSTREQFV